MPYLYRIISYFLTALTLTFQTASLQAGTSTCTRALQPVNVSQPKTVVGTGTPASCTEQALKEAIWGGGIITFKCGSAPVTIYLKETHQLKNYVNTTIDGGNLITLDGSKMQTRMFWAKSGGAPWYGGTPPYYRSTHTTVTFQNITLANGREQTGTPIPPLPKGAPSKCSQGTGTDGGGGAIMVTDIILHAINVKFINNQAAQLGPDVAGGAIYALGSLGVVIQDSTFQNNSAANGGAIGALQTEITAVNTTFSRNTASGNGANNNDQSSGCPLYDGQYQTGSGGNGGAISMDGGSDTVQSFCGDVFDHNAGGANALGGALFRAADAATQTTNINQSEFDANTSPSGGAIYSHNTYLNITKTTFALNLASTGGAIQADASTVNLTNDSFYGNNGSVGWGALALFGGGGAVLNSTFAGNVGGVVNPVLSPGVAMTLNNNIFENNVLGSGTNISCSSTLPGNNNMSWPATGGPSQLNGCAANSLQQMSMVESLAGNGGFARTMAIPTNSPANDYGHNCPEKDERGIVRPELCAAGAYQPQ